MLGLKQNSGDNLCVAVVAAQAFNSTVETFMICTDGEPPYSDMDFCKYAFREGYICGFGIDEEQFCTKIDVTDSNSLEPEFLFNQNEITPETKIKIEFQLKNYPAYVVVQNEIDSSKEHALYWDGQQIWDPNPMVKNGRNLNKYKILRWFPIIKLED